MTTATMKSQPAWQAEVVWRKHRYTTEEMTPPDETGDTAEGATVEIDHWALRCYVDVFKPEGERIRFLVNHREGRCLSFTDPRERSTGTAGTTGVWGTRPAQRRPAAFTDAHGLSDRGRAADRGRTGR